MPRIIIGARPTCTIQSRHCALRLAPTFAAMGSNCCSCSARHTCRCMAALRHRPLSRRHFEPSSSAPLRVADAWSTGRITPWCEHIREFQLAAGVPRDQLYNTTCIPLRDAESRADLQLHDQAGRSKWNMSEEESPDQRRAPRARRIPAWLVRYRQSGLDPRPRCFWPCRHPLAGVCGRRSKRGRLLIDDFRPAGREPSVRGFAFQHYWKNNDREGKKECLAPMVLLAA